MKKIAIVFETNFSAASGMKNAVLSRIKALKLRSPFQIDVFCIHYKPAGLNRIIRKRIQDKPMDLEGIPIKTLWYKEYLFDDILSNRLRLPPFFMRFWYRKTSKMLADYDLISTHGFTAGMLALVVKRHYSIPYYATWHGSDIHSAPYYSSYLMRSTTAVMKNAQGNFFVSHYLEREAKKICSSIVSCVLYNGLSDVFYTYDKCRKEELRKKYRCQSTKVVAFVGSISEVKNVMVLPKLFKAINEKFLGDVVFWVIGEGYQKTMLLDAVDNCKINCVFWGKIDLLEMPSLMNCIDVLVLPSKKESFGLVLLEAIACGANAVGSNTGGIPEVIGDDNVFDLSDSFVDKTSSRVVEMLKGNVKQEVGPFFNWDMTAIKEMSFYKKALL